MILKKERLRFDYLAFGLPPKVGLPPNPSIFISPQASHQLNPALLQPHVWTNDRIINKNFTRHIWTRKNLLSFGCHPHSDRHPGISWKILQHYQTGHYSTLWLVNNWLLCTCCGDSSEQGGRCGRCAYKCHSKHRIADRLDCTGEALSNGLRLRRSLRASTSTPPFLLLLPRHGHALRKGKLRRCMYFEFTA